MRSRSRRGPVGRCPGCRRYVYSYRELTYGCRDCKQEQNTGLGAMIREAREARREAKQ